MPRPQPVWWAATISPSALPLANPKIYPAMLVSRMAPGPVLQLPSRRNFMMNFTTTTRRSRRSRPLSPTRSSGPSIRKWEISCQAAETCLGITWAWNDTPIAVLAHAELLLPGGYRLASQVLLSQDGTTRGRPNPAPHQQSDSMRDLPMRQNTHSITVSGEQPLSQQRHHHQLWQTVQPQLHHRPPPLHLLSQ